VVHYGSLILRINLKGFAMNNNWAKLGISLLVVGFSGCASMNADECANSDWTAIGYEDGSRGYTTDRFANRRKACAKHGVTANFQAYQQGRDQGLIEFCQPARGYNLGVNGGRYNGVCAAEYEMDFLDAYRAGYELHTLRSNVANANSRIQSKEYELERIEKKSIATGALLVGSDMTTEERILALSDLKKMSKRTGQLEAEIEALHVELAHREDELRHYENTVVDFGY
jgi:hypothetical protein